MAEVRLRIAGRDYAVTCPDGDEAHIAALGTRIDMTARDAQQLVGSSIESRLWLFTALLLADRLQEMEQAAAAAPPDAGEQAALDPSYVVDAVGRIADRAEALALALEKLADRA